jgi:beta-lactam-binding protein with PASTA domain
MMKAFSVILVAFTTAVVTAGGTVVAIQRFHLLEPRPEPVSAQPVPDLTGLLEADALTNLTTSGFKLMVAGREPNAEAGPGTVIRQEPAAGSPLEPGQVVRVTFAVEVPQVPNVLGKSVADATQALEGLGYVVEVQDPAPSADHAAGLIVEQVPRAGSALAKKEKVALTPSAGAGTVEVPKLIGLNVGSAKVAAEKASLQLAIQWVALAETATNVVLYQKPAAGETVEPESEVRVTVNR